MVEKRFLIFSLLFLVVVLSGCEESVQMSPGCVIPEEGMIISEDVVFCPGIYNFNDGFIMFNLNGVTVDCDGAVIRGGSVAFWLDNVQGSTIKNCVLENFDEGFRLMQSNNNYFSNNNIVGGNGIDSALSSNNHFIENEIVGQIGVRLDYASNDNEFLSNYLCGSDDADLICYQSNGNYGDSNEICVVQQEEGCYEEEGFDFSVSVSTISSSRLYEGNIYSLSGEGFGNKNPVEPILFDRVFDQSAYAGLSSGDSVPSGSSYPWLYNGHSSDYNEGNVLYWETSPRISGRPYYLAEGSGFLAREDEGINQPDEMYVNWWFRTNYDISEYAELCDGGPNGQYRYSNTEIFRIRPRYNAGSGSGWVSWQSRWLERGNTFQEVDPVCTENVGYWYPSRNYQIWSDVSNPGEWHNFEIYVNSEGHDVGQGTLSAWSDGKIEHDNLIFCSDQPVNLVRAVGAIPDKSWCFEQVYGSPLEISFSDIYIDSTLSKIMICNVDSWYDRAEVNARCEMQIPVDVWEGDSIRFKANRGSFPKNQELYLYVMNSEGNVNPVGYPISFPQKPQGTKVKPMQIPIDPPPY
jgi:hypothetical protein